MKKKISQIRDAGKANSSQGRTIVSIFHDNPQLSKSIGAEEGMEILVESALTKTSVKMLFGKVVFSGTFDATAAGVDFSKVRGNDIILAEVTELISSDLGKFPFRVNDGIKELQLKGSNIPEIDRQTDDISQEDVAAFFAPCTGRVDVILQPIQHDNHTFYPYFEGTRKLAPQFRSHGVGYIRLGDDMSNFGTAFISLDQGKSFLDGGANDAIIMSSAPVPPKSAKKQPMQAQDNGNELPSKELLRSAKKVRIQTGTEFSKSMPEMKLSGVLTRAAAKRAALATEEPPVEPRLSTETRDSPVSSRKRNRASIENQSPPNQVVSTIQFQSPEPSAKKMKLAESLRRSVRASRTKSLNSNSNLLPTPKKLSMSFGASISNSLELEEYINSSLSELQEVDQSGVGGVGWKAKVDIMKRFQKDLQLLPSDDIASSVNATSLIRLLDTLREQIVKTSNPMYTVTVIDVVPTIATVFLSHSLPDSSCTNTAWYAILSECLQQLRNSNRQIEVAASRSLNTLAKQALLSWSVLLQVTESWLGLLPGTTAPKNLLKFNKILEFLEQRVLVDGKNCGSGLFQPPEQSVDLLSRLARIAVVGTKDRDEKCRTAGMQLLTAVVIAEIITHKNQFESSVADIVDCLSNNTPNWFQDELQKAAIPLTKVTALVDIVFPRFALSS
jgi:hypothetical protein